MSLVNYEKFLSESKVQNHIGISEQYLYLYIFLIKNYFKIIFNIQACKYRWALEWHSSHSEVDSLLL